MIYDPLWSRTYQLNGVIALTLRPIAVDRVGVLGGRLRQTNVVVPDTVIFAVKPENGASLERSKATHYNLRLLLVFILLLYNPRTVCK